MVARLATFAFDGVEAHPLDVEVQLPGEPVAFMIAGLDGSETVRRVHSAEALSYRFRPASSTCAPDSAAIALSWAGRGTPVWPG